MKKNILLTFFLFIISFTSAQIAPPAPAQPSTENKVLIDELIKVTNFEKYVYNYCVDKVSQTSQENNWDDKKKQEIIKSIYFNQFADTIYNTFALYSTEELQSLIKLFKKLENSKRNIQLVPMSDTIQHNLEGFATEITKGDYLFLNK